MIGLLRKFHHIWLVFALAQVLCGISEYFQAVALCRLLSVVFVEVHVWKPLDHLAQNSAITS